MGLYPAGSPVALAGRPEGSLCLSRAVSWGSRSGRGPGRASDTRGNLFYKRPPCWLTQRLTELMPGVMLGPGSGRFWVLLTTLQGMLLLYSPFALRLSLEKLSSVAKDLEWQVWSSAPGSPLPGPPAPCSTLWDGWTVDGRVGSAV